MAQSVSCRMRPPTGTDRLQRVAGVVKQRGVVVCGTSFQVFEKTCGTFEK